MSAVNQAQQRAAAKRVDTLLQPSVLLVIELQQGAVPQGGEALWERCIEQVSHLREELDRSGLAPRHIDCISHAQCALLDETLLTNKAGEAYPLWARESLQARFFNHHQAGERIYQELQEALRDPVPDLHVLTAFQRILLLGFKGRYQQLDHPERAQLLASLNARVAPMEPCAVALTQGAPSGRVLHEAPSLLTQCLLVVTLLTLAWWGLDTLLGASIAQLAVQR